MHHVKKAKERYSVTNRYGPELLGDLAEVETLFLCLQFGIHKAFGSIIKRCVHKMNEQRTITIAGAGFSGTTILANQIKSIRNEWIRAGQPNDFPKTKIIIADPSDQLGNGQPYRHYSPDDIALLNQPAYAMSPFTDEPDHFVKWLQNHEPDTSRYDLENSFQRRSTYGEYLKSIFRKSVQQTRWTNFPVEVEILQTTLTDAFQQSNGTWQCKGQGQDWNSDSIIVADGHYKNDFLEEFKDHSLYFDGHLHRQEFKTIHNNHNRVLIVGSGQSMMDRLAELDHYGYKGEIHAVSRRLVLPWLFKPELYRSDSQLSPYILTVFTAEKIKNATTGKELQSLWDQEINLGNANGYGTGHVLSAFFKDADLQNLQHPNPQLWQSQLGIIKATYGNPTSPKRYDLYQEAIQRQQFMAYQSSISADQITPQDNGFDVQFDTGLELSYDAIFNTASCARTLGSPQTGEIHSPLIQKLHDSGYINWANLQEGVIKAGEQTAGGLYYAGPYSYQGKWGCETFRDGHATIATQALQLQERLQLAA